MIVRNLVRSSGSCIQLLLVIITPPDLWNTYTTYAESFYTIFDSFNFKTFSYHQDIITFSNKIFLTLQQCLLASLKTLRVTFLKLYLFIEPSADVNTRGCRGTFLSATPSLSARLNLCRWISVYLNGFGVPPPQMPGIVTQF